MPADNNITHVSSTKEYAGMFTRELPVIRLDFDDLVTLPGGLVCRPFVSSSTGHYLTILSGNLRCLYISHLDFNLDLVAGKIEIERGAFAGIPHWAHEADEPTLLRKPARPHHRPYRKRRANKPSREE
jgi:hypothetical protein